MATQVSDGQEQQIQASSDPASQPLPELQVSEVDDDDAEKEESGLCGERTLWTRIWQGLAGASMVVNVIAMAIEASAASIVAGVVALMVGPVVIKRQFEIQDTQSMRDVQNDLRRQVNRLQMENVKLAASNTRLEAEVGKLKETEAKLEKITTEQGLNVDAFVELVKENRKILDQMEACVTAETMQTLVAAILESDMNSSATFTAEELYILEMRLKNIPGVVVNRPALERTVLESSRSLSSVLQIVKDMERDDIPPEEKIFRLSEEPIAESPEES